MTDLIVIGAGFFGATVAREAADAGLRVQIFDRRDHVAGNAHTYRDPATGIEIHKFGAHLFHTSNEKVWKFVNHFARFNSYEHKVWTEHSGGTFSMPINLATINQFYASSMGPDEARALVQLDAAEIVGAPANLEEKAISLIGRPLYEAFVKGYTQKQWQTDPKLLPASIIARLPVRYNYDNRYFSDAYQGIPTEGYTRLVENMLEHPRIDVHLRHGVDARFHSCPVVYTGPVDAYFGYEYGRLGWRTVDFKFQHLDGVVDHQGTSVVNFADVDLPQTRRIEFKHFRPDRTRQMRLERTIIADEYSRFAGADDEPYYPIGTPDDRAKLQRYRELMRDETDVYFGGRLGTYQYLDMHMAIASAMTMWKNELLPRFSGKKD